MKQLVEWVKKNPQMTLGFVQVTLGQIATWTFLPKEVAGTVSSIVGLLQVWSSFFFTWKQKKAEEAQKEQEGV